MYVSLSLLIAVASVSVSHALFGPKTLKSLIVPDSQYPTLSKSTMNKLAGETTTSLFETITAPFFPGVILFQAFGQFGINKIKGKSKDKDGKVVSALLQKGFSQLLGIVNPDANKVPKGYSRYANDNAVQNLEHFLRSNPFLTTSLIPDGSGYKISSTDASNRFSTVLKSLDPAVERVNAKFDSKMCLTKIWYEGTSESKSEKNAVDINAAAAKLLWNLVYAAEIIHISLHIFHYLMTVGLVYGTIDNKALLAWAKTHVYNLDVALDGVDSALLNAKKGAFIVAPVQSDRPQTLQIVRKYLSEWGKSKTSADFTKWLFAPSLLTKLRKDGHVVEFLRHESFIKDYSSALSRSLKENDVPAYDNAEERMKSFLSAVGSSTTERLNSVSSIQQWIEVMAVSGLLHGATGSWTRLTFTSDYYRYANKNPVYGEAESTFAGLAALTNVLPQKDLYVFKDRGIYSRSIRETIAGFDKKTTDAKAAHLERSKLQPYFNEYGWIYSDYFPDNFDGRSAAITYY
jgi:hypothetical protein